MAIQTIKWVNGSVKIIDQTKLPAKLTYIYCRDVKTLWKAIRRLSVRGAPALGVAAAFGILLGIRTFKGKDKKKFVAHFRKIKNYIKTSRPTAVNLFNALEAMEQVVRDNPQASVSGLKNLLKKKAFAIFEEDRKVCRTKF